MEAYHYSYRQFVQSMSVLHGPQRQFARRTDMSTSKGARLALWNRIAALLAAFTAGDCANCFRNAGYAS
jgi:hypothetical protein